MSMQTPTAADVLQFYLDDALTGCFVALPGQVQSYDPTTESVHVIPMVKRVSRDADGDRIVETLPVLPSVPVSWTRGGGYFIRLPLVAGDGGTILFPDMDIGAWLHSGQVSDPGDERMHAIGGAIFLPGLETVARVLTGVATGHMVLGQEGGPQIHVDGSTVQLGAAGGNFVALSNLVTTQLNTLKSAISGAAVVAGDGGASFKAAIIAALSAWPGSVAATKAKAT